MTQFIGGVIMLLFGLWILRKIYKSAESPSQQRLESELQISELRNKLALLRVEEKLLALQQHINRRDRETCPEALIEPQAEGEFKSVADEFNRRILDDAMNQAFRAKAALVQVLKQQGCSDEEIGQVLEKVDGE